MRNLIELLKLFYSDWRFKTRLKVAIKKHNGRALCYYCLSPLDWHNYEDREIQITQSTKIMLFCPECHCHAKDGTLKPEGTGIAIARAFRRYYLTSGLPQETPTFQHCLNNVLNYYGWLKSADEESTL